jgi:hypothetical protein
MPLYNCSSVAAALGVSAKWLDNLLSHNDLSGVHKARQGVARRLSTEAVATIAIANLLNTHANVPIPTGLKIATQLLESPSHSLSLGDALSLSLDRPTLAQLLTHHIASAVEITPTPRRGRPKRAP